ncbi:MAG: c-type cytochrome [Candidatus Sedimenticola sp. (ex Thyasira tokunagai)]
MVYKTITTAILAAGLTLGATFAVSAADKPKLMMGASASMLANTCAGCHGTNGASQGPAAPSIAGMSAESMTEAMEGFASGDIPSTIMGRIAKGYDQAETKAMAEFYSKLPVYMAKQSFDAAQVKKGAKLHDKYCEKCHADGGVNTEDGAALAGQWTTYLNWSLADFNAGKRDGGKKMKKKLKKLVAKEGSKGISALLNYYASQQK